jgi:hypothetical protein
MGALVQGLLGSLVNQMLLVVERRVLHTRGHN